MTGDPCEVMMNVIEQESSLLEAIANDDLLVDAQAIAEAEQQRARRRDRLEAARGLRIGVGVPGACLRGVVAAVGDELVVLETPGECTAIAVTSILWVEGLPHALRREAEHSRAVCMTWSSLLRRWCGQALVRITLVDGHFVRAWLESVGSDHVDIREADGVSRMVLHSAISTASADLAQMDARPISR
ncbi:MAG: hypothetical protein ACR2JS_02600 [Candidatus Nanopelagicales bacterium]